MTLSEAGPVRKTITMRLHLWLENDQGVLCGHGRIQLLEYIAFTGSLRAAAKSLGMAYRAAWGKLKATEQAIGVQLVETPDGSKSGTTLTEDGKALVAAYRAWLSEVEAFAIQSAAAHFDYEPAKYWSMKDIPSPPSTSSSFPLPDHSKS